jgi:hypothetical protein
MSTGVPARRAERDHRALPRCADARHQGSERLSLPLVDRLQGDGLDGRPVQFSAVSAQQARIWLFVTPVSTRET